MTHEPAYIPDGITLGNQVVVIPAVLSGLSHSGFLTMTTGIRNYSWVSRGDVIATFSVRQRRTDAPVLKWFAGEEVHSVDIRSPASGLFIHRNFDFCSSEHSSLTAILLPDDEPAAEDGHYMYEGLRRLCRENKAAYLQPSRFWSMPAFEPKELEELLERQVSFSCQYLDAMPKYHNCFDEARTKFPSLRPYLKHLQ